MKIRQKMCFSVMMLFILSVPMPLFAVNGYFLHGVGAVNESMGGAATAGNASDVIGSLHRNPANATVFEKSTAAISLEVLLPDVTISSSFPLGDLVLEGETDSDVDAIPGANLGLVYHSDAYPAALYCGLMAEAGLHLKLPQSQTNPILLPQQFGGFGAVETQLEVVRIPLGCAWDYNDRLSLGVALAPSIARMKFTPAAFAAPDDADQSGIPTYPDDIDHDFAFGIGVQAGVRYQVTDDMHLGFTITSPTWFDSFEWDTKDEAGGKRRVSFKLNRPMTISAGGSYRMPSDTLLLMDVSWINYADTKGFEDTGFAADGSLKGLGFDDIFTVALGAQQPVGDKLNLRCGYNYGQNPIDDDYTFFNIGSPLHNEHHLSLGMSWAMTGKAYLDVGYSYAFETSQSGPMVLPGIGQVPGTEVESSLSYHHIALGVTVSY